MQSGDGDADTRQLYELVGDLELVRASLAHAEAILRAIAAHPDAHFGNPGPLVHLVESFADYPELLRGIATTPALHFVGMLARLVNDDLEDWPLERIEAYAADPAAPPAVRAEAALARAELASE